MSLKKKKDGFIVPTIETEIETAPAIEVAEVKEDVQKVYCGPTINGVARNFQVFTGGLPEGLNKMCETNPVVGALVVPISDLPDAWTSIKSGKGKYAAFYNTLLKK